MTTESNNTAAIKKDIIAAWKDAENLSGEERAIIFAIDAMSARGLIVKDR